MKVERIVFINRAPFDALDLDLSNKQVISLTGINGSGKTTILSHLVDAFYEFARKGFPNEFSGIKAGKLYRISSQLYNKVGTSNSLVYISFMVEGKYAHYVDLLGNVDEKKFNDLMGAIWNNNDVASWPIRYSDIEHQLKHENQFAKYLKIENNDAINVFSNNLLTYFPSYRYEQPGYLNDVFQMELSYKYSSNFNGYLINPIEVTSGLPELANWMMDVVLDSEMYKNNDILQKIQQIVSNILLNKRKEAVRIGIGPRNMGGARIQVVDEKTGYTIYPTIFNISAGESALLCLFGELLKQADKIGKSIESVEGIVLIDEIDKHLHIMLQKEVVPALIQMFPKVQFIISTHSAFFNMGLTDIMGDRCSILDLDNCGMECLANKNDVFREAYNAMIEENKRYVNFCDSISDRLKDITKPIVYLEGRTDEKYFNRAVELFGYTNKIEFQWIGHLDKNGNEVFTGSGSLSCGMQFIKGRNNKFLQFFLFDCDTKKQESDDGNIVTMTMPFYTNHTVMNKGIENALELDDIELDAFYEEHTKNGDYGKVTTIREFNKMKMCDYICSMDNTSQEKVFANLKPVIEKIIARAEKQSARDSNS
ncbi:MAG: hypothetical protein E7200_03910 [Selenomonas ruminantium]|nr:hypothetical protein [Selenomonas ruminantium]